MTGAGRDGPPVLEAVGVSHRFGQLAVLAEVDFHVTSGEAVGVVGPNGAGKTTLLNVLSGALRPDAGHVRFAGEDVTRVPIEQRCRMGVGRAHQVPRPFGGMTVFENVLVGATHGRGMRRHAAYGCSIEAIDRCQLGRVANRRADTLGLLDRKRLELARSLATGPSVLLLDEIGGGLTDAEALDLLDTIRDIRHEGVAIVWIEHLVHVLVQAIDRLVCFDQGRVLADDEPRVVMANPVVIEAYLGSAEL
jgi:branched-chain amino acid transport system ATP-binding protein